MLRVPIRSRFGNAALGVLGVLYFFSASATLGYYVVTSWGAIGPLDLTLQCALVVSALAGVFFMEVASDNLGLAPPRRLRSVIASLFLIALPLVGCGSGDHHVQPLASIGIAVDEVSQAAADHQASDAEDSFEDDEEVEF
jgi:hypothetical protein